ncbi:MAG: aminodeoxychorismate synthase component I [Chitinophagales bacterium]|nr:aminodeoxychorismate synthase component I [Hyphomicrobiales bacterium]
MSFVLLDNSLEPGGKSYLFADPVEIVEAREVAQVDAALDRIQAAVNGGLYAAGYFSYELGHLFEPRLAPRLPVNREAPLIWIGLFNRREEMDAASVAKWLEARTQGEHKLSNITPSVGFKVYNEKITRALAYIAAGDIYQLNLTFKAKFDFSGDPVSLYRSLRARQKVPYGALLSTPEHQILSLSPELFLTIEGRLATTRPMKGTSRRGVHAGEDARLSAWLASDVKSRAENLMIVDLMRNDLGRIADIGSVNVTDLFSVETYQTVLQMTSGVTANLREGVDFKTLLRAIFPPGSITGAPKVRAMEIIEELEDEPRGVYTGAIGMVAPSGDCVFNVVIRTLVIGADGSGEIGIGSGVVQDSNAASEYDECLLKMRFLTDHAPPFQLIETLLWEPGAGFWLLDRHLARLEASAAHFVFAFDGATVRQALAAHVAQFEGRHRVRITMDVGGALNITSTPLARADSILRFAIAETRMNTANPFLYHKTTRRDFYDNERIRLSQKLPIDEVVFLNERGQLTEGSFTNLFIEKNGRMLTPAAACGLLPGTLRQELLEAGEAMEATLTLRDLADADAVWLGNSVRGLVRAAPADAFIIQASAVKPRARSRQDTAFTNPL